MAELPRMAFAEIGRPSRRMRAQSITTLSTIRMASRIRSMKWRGLCRLPLCRLPQVKRMTFVGFLLNFVETMMKHLKLSKQCFHSWWTYHVIAFNEWMTCNRLLPRRQLLVPVVSWMPLDNKQLTTWVHGAPLVFSLFSVQRCSLFQTCVVLVAYTEVARRLYEESVHRLGRFMARAGCQLSLGDGV